MFSTHSQSTEELWLQPEVQHQVRIFCVFLKKRNLSFFPAIKFIKKKIKIARDEQFAKDEQDHFKLQGTDKFFEKKNIIMQLQV